MSAVARGIAEADSVGTAANTQAATLISNRRFISQSPWSRTIAARSKCSGKPKVPVSAQATAIAMEPPSIATG
jgi:hypothetical protein